MIPALYVPIPNPTRHNEADESGKDRDEKLATAPWREIGA